MDHSGPSKMSITEKNRALEARYPGLRARLGKEPDPGIAQDYDYEVSASYISLLRRERDIAPFVKKIPAAAVFFMGRLPDSVVGKMADVSGKTVRRLRRERGVAACDKGKNSLRGIVGKLGKEPDDALSLEFGLSRTRVMDLRNLMGIAPCGHKKGRGRSKKLDKDEIERLVRAGKTDMEIAEGMGCAATTVGIVRSRDLGLKLKDRESWLDKPETSDSKADPEGAAPPEAGTAEEGVEEALVPVEEEVEVAEVVEMPPMAEAAEEVEVPLTPEAVVESYEDDHPEAVKEPEVSPELEPVPILPADTMGRAIALLREVMKEMGVAAITVLADE